jgi:hypothetical protein
MSKESAKLLSVLIKEIITDRFKKMARDENLTKFLSSKIEPAKLVDFHVSAEREALQLSVDRVESALAGSDLDRALKEVALRIQSNFQAIYGSDVLPINQAPELLLARSLWLRSRVDFYTRWINVKASEGSAKDLALAAFRSEKAFRKFLDQIFAADENLCKEVVRSTNPTFRLLMKKQFELETQQARLLWDACSKSWFKAKKELSDV